MDYRFDKLDDFWIGKSKDRKESWIPTPFQYSLNEDGVWVQIPNRSDKKLKEFFTKEFDID